MAHICVSNLTIIGSNNGLSPGWRQAIIWTNDGQLLIGPLGTNFSEILIEILTFSIKKMRLKVSSWKWRPFYLGRDKMAAIFQTTLSNAFSCMKMLEFRLKFHWSLFLRVQLTIVHHWFRWWLGADQATSHYLNQWWLDYWRIYASLGLNELKTCSKWYSMKMFHSHIIWYYRYSRNPL